MTFISKIPGDLSGSAPASGYVGQIIYSGVIQSNAVPLTASAHTTVTSLQFTSNGVWNISFIVIRFRNGSSLLSTAMNTGFASETNSVTGCFEGVNYIDYHDVVGTGNAFEYFSSVLQPVPCVVSGSTLTLPSGSTMTLTNKTIYLVAGCGTMNSGNIKAFGNLTAVRIT